MAKTAGLDEAEVTNWFCREKKKHQNAQPVVSKDVNDDEDASYKMTAAV
jgi:hypothetical protein